ncbi:MAG: hypothetical protein LBU32_31650 [Clostridiales bacterium]|jgi:hypothetical protein|nr:hypothetical protein [Clostridiales bacterium]
MDAEACLYGEPAKLKYYEAALYRGEKRAKNLPALCEIDGVAKENIFISLKKSSRSPCSAESSSWPA